MIPKYFFLKRFFRNLPVSIVMILLFGTLGAQSSIGFERLSGGSPVYDLAEASSFETLATDDYDLGGCQQECRSKYGIDPYRFGGGSSSIWHLYAICIQECNLKFWKEYDKRIKELKELEVK